MGWGGKLLQASTLKGPKGVSRSPKDAVRRSQRVIRDHRGSPFDYITPGLKLPLSEPACTNTCRAPMCIRVSDNIISDKFSFVSTNILLRSHISFTPPRYHFRETAKLLKAFSNITHFCCDRECR